MLNAFSDHYVQNYAGIIGGSLTSILQISFFLNVPLRSVFALRLVLLVSFVTVRAKTNLVHTSNFAKLMVHKNLKECHTQLNFSTMIK